jgi:hypothetical protein
VNCLTSHAHLMLRGTASRAVFYLLVADFKALIVQLRERCNACPALTLKTKQLCNGPSPSQYPSGPLSLATFRSPGVQSSD